MKRIVHPSGFTYIELVISVAIIALTLAFAAPSMETFSKSQKVKNAAREIYTNLQLARMTAIGENKTVNVIFSLNPAASMSIRDNGGSDVIQPVDFQKSTPGVILSSSKSGLLTYSAMGTVGGGAQTITVSRTQTATKYDVVINASGGLSLAKQ